MKRQTLFRIDDKMSAAVNKIVLLGAITLIFMCYMDGCNGNDFWWHVKVGEYIVAHRSIPTTDIFSWYGTSIDLPWTAHEWLSEVLFYLLYRFTGETGIFVLSFTAAITLTLLMWSRLKKYPVRPIVAEIYIFLFAMLTSKFCYGRPHLFGFFLLYFELVCLFDYYDDRSSKKIWWLPVISMLWSNLHGGSSNLSYLLCIAFLLAGLPRKDLGRLAAEPFSRKEVRTVVLVTVCTAAAILINPIGWRVFIYPYVSLADSVSMNNISEWLSPDAKDLFSLVMVYLPIAGVALQFVVTPKKIRYVDILFFLLFCYLSFRSIRFIMLWYIAVAVVAFRYAPEISTDRHMKRHEQYVCAACCAVLAALMAYGVFRMAQKGEEGELVSTAISDAAIEAVRADAPERLFNDYDYGEALIFNDIPVFFDARADLYSSPGILTDGFSMMNLTYRGDEEDGSFDFQAICGKYDFDSFLVPKSRALYVYLSSHEDIYELIYEDETVAYFRVVAVG